MVFMIVVRQKTLHYVGMHVLRYCRTSLLPRCKTTVLYTDDIFYPRAAQLRRRFRLRAELFSKKKKNTSRLTYTLYESSNKLRAAFLISFFSPSLRHRRPSPPINSCRVTLIYTPRRHCSLNSIKPNRFRWSSFPFFSPFHPATFLFLIIYLAHSLPLYFSLPLST